MNNQFLNDGFLAMPIEKMEEITPGSGATGGLLYPSKIAENYCGMKELNIGDIMVYGFRRFGYPVNGWDDYKQLCMWVIRTPMEGVFLSLTPTNVSPFGFILKHPLSQQLLEEQSLPIIEWGRRCRQWANETYDIVLVDQFRFAGFCTDEEAEMEYFKWLGKQGLAHTDERAKQFLKEKSDECAHICKKYEKIEPLPNKHLPFELIEAQKTPFWESLPKDSLEHKINEAIYRTILDMKRPVSIRDWQINIEGECGDEGFRIFDVDEDGYVEISEDYFTPTAKSAGYGMPCLSKLLEENNG